MTSTTPTSISALARGQELAAAHFTISRDRVAAYLDAVGDRGDYGDAVPPLAAVALALEALQSEISLPEGSLHTGQEVEHHAALTAEEPLTMTGRVAQRSERQGYVISVLELEVASMAGVAVRARATIMAPAAAS
jgi:hypothetical protein